MRAELRSLDSPDAPGGLDAWSPTNPSDFAIQITAEIGSIEEKGADLFFLTVVGPGWFAMNRPGLGFRWGRGYLIVDRWDPGVVRRAIEDLCRHAEAPDWQAVAQNINQNARWEFDNYRNNTPTPGSEG